MAELVARGTDEPLDPSFGIIVGDPLYNAVKKLVPTVIGYAVNVRQTTMPRRERMIDVQNSIPHHLTAIRKQLAPTTLLRISRKRQFNVRT